MALKRFLFGGVACSAALAMAGPARADDASAAAAESRLRVETAIPSGHGNAIENADQIDQLVTNNQLRALSGSTSRWSISSALAYNGGSVQTPLAEDRPNIADLSGTIVKSLLDGQVSVKYNIDVQDSVNAGVGLRWIAPLSAGGPKEYNGAAFDADNPYLTYQRLFRWLGVQSVLQAQYTKFTNANLVAEGYEGEALLNQENMYEIPGTRLSIGFNSWIEAQWFSKTGPVGTPGTSSYLEDVRDDQSDYAVGFFPELEYQITEAINFRTMLGLWSFEHMRSASGPNTYKWSAVYQSVGFGIALTRDVFLYPNVQFLPDNVDSARTNVGLNATINVF